MIHTLPATLYFQVWAAIPPWKQGSLAEFVALTEFEVSRAVVFTVPLFFYPTMISLFLRWQRDRHC